jgi:NADH:ubiquinone oxidoreductase subunit E
VIIEREKMEIEICVGSSCYLKGSSQVIKKMQEYIELNALEEILILKGTFCLGECTRGVSIKIAKEVYSVNERNCLEVLHEMLEVTHAAD